MRIKEITNLRFLIEKFYQEKGRKPKIICDWDDVIQVHLPLLTWELKEEKIPFQDFYKNFWQKEFVTSKQFKVNCGINKEGEKKSKYEELIKRSDFYKDASFLSPAKELLTSLQAETIESLIFLTACDKSSFSDSDPRKIEIFKKTFGNFSSTQLNFIPFTIGSIPPKWQWIKENCPDFDIFIDDNPHIVSRTMETFPLNKIYALPDYNYNKVVEDNVCLLTAEIASLTEESFRLTTQIEKNESCFYQEN
ncbi:Putative Esterase/lipase [endosymbiont DhMRE of Dentiscutata heterogama]|uniref:hypothetical protein n=1 Tax=endosymbiont DhMRE of Dentiscutata heterogama TaxID=1609546 RepID=UPI000629D49A|nr:hypothetical protein [endosymbiont DhMRE of Dentiscutata heterogama]CFW92772.1 Putative Esterase/lipase [endosymbiont DhMRE of Dentiscutata heterogama]